MVVLEGGAVSYERGTPVVQNFNSATFEIRTFLAPSGALPPGTKPARFSGDTTPCKVTPVILHGVVSPAIQSTELRGPASDRVRLRPPGIRRQKDTIIAG